MIQRFLLLASLIMLAGCSGGGSAVSTTTPTSLARPSAATSGGGTSPTLGILATPAANPTSGASAAAATASDQTGGSQALPQPSGFRPSGALIRVANIYHGSATVAPGPIDVYGTYGTADTDTPLMTVPYGTISDWFDPGILDDARNAEITFFPHGAHSANDEIASQSETLSGTERISLFMATGDSTNAAGQSFGTWETVFETSTINPLATAPAGQALVLLNTLDLPKVPGVTADYVYLSAGGACLSTTDNPGSPQPIAANRVTTGFIPYALPPGTQELSLHLDGSSCADKGVTNPFPVQLTAGQRAFVLLYSPDGASVKSLVVPIEP